MWLAHVLTLSRLPIAIALTWTYGDAAWSVALVALAAATDAADGNVARWMQRRGHTGPDIGGWLDPLVDKIFVVIVLATMWWHTRALGVIALIAAREVLLVPLLGISLALGKVRGKLHADWLGKIATIAQFVACGVAVAVPGAVLPFAIAAGALGVAAVIHYAAAARA